jgi:hypothetical protein
MSSAIRWFLVLNLAIFLATPPQMATAAPPPQKTSAQDLHRFALEQEIQGNAALRQKFLRLAVEKDEDYAPARWQLGQLQYTGEWRNYQEIPGEEAKRPEVQEYRKLRQQLSATAQGHLELANWCRGHNLPRQERAHLTAAL